MANTAIIVGNTNYDNSQNLDCCADDVAAIKELILATQKFDSIQDFLNYDAHALKTAIRKSISPETAYDEVFFYFSGHGHQNTGEFFYCTSNFDLDRPNETGLSNSELHELLKAGNAKLIVKVIDACSSGQVLVKSDGAFMSYDKSGFEHLVQIASCLDSQNSLTGEPLSQFTEKFRDAALRKERGEVYYSDIVNTLRDEFINDNTQTPHFVTQGTGRDQFVGEAALLDKLRDKIRLTQNENQDADIVPQTEEPLSILERLREIDDGFANKERSEMVISGIFSGILSEFEKLEDIADCYETSHIEHRDFSEGNTRNFIVKILAREERPDKFVTAEIVRRRKNRDNFYGKSNIVTSLGWMLEGDSYAENYVLEINCSFEKVQMKFSLTPKFRSLKKVELIVSCAPSLTNCYVFEMLREHQLTSWDSFDSEGSEVYRKWYKLNWAEDPNFLVDKIIYNLVEATTSHISSITKAFPQT